MKYSCDSSTLQYITEQCCSHRGKFGFLKGCGYYLLQLVIISDSLHNWFFDQGFKISEKYFNNNFVLAKIKKKAYWYDWETKEDLFIVIFLIIVIFVFVTTIIIIILLPPLENPRQWWCGCLTLGVWCPLHLCSTTPFAIMIIIIIVLILIIVVIIRIIITNHEKKS